MVKLTHSLLMDRRRSGGVTEKCERFGGGGRGGRSEEEEEEKAEEEGGEEGSGGFSHPCICPPPFIGVFVCVCLKGWRGAVGGGTRQWWMCQH